MTASIRRAFTFAAALAALLTCASGGALAAYPKLDWIYRVKPDAVPRSVVFLSGNILAAQGVRNQLHLINVETGGPIWEYGLDERADMFPLAEGSILAAAGGVLHRLDYTARKRAWSSPVCQKEPRRIFISPDLKTAAVQCPGAKVRVYDLATGASKIADSVPADAAPASPEHVAELNSSLLGPDTTLNIQGKTASLYSGAVQSLVWSYTAGENLAPTAALLGGKVLLLTAAGNLTALDKQTGAELYSVDLRKTIDMRFWDELPHRINNYSASRIFTSDGAVYVLPPSGIAKLHIQPFPPEIKLGGAPVAEDSTQQWALNKAIQAWDRNDFNSALKAFDEAAQIWPDSPEVLMFMGMAHSALRDAKPEYLDLSITELQRAWKVAPRNPDVVANLIGNLMLKAMTLDQRTEKEKIIGLYRLMATSDPYSLVPLAGLAEIYLSHGGAGDAAAVIMDSFDYGFYGPDQFNMLITALYIQDDRLAALDVMDKSMALFPESRFAYIMKAKLLSKEGRYAESAKVFDSAPSATAQAKPEVSGYPSYMMTGERFFRANAAGLSGRLPEAIKMLKEYIAWLPTPAELKDMKSKSEAAASQPRGSASEVTASFDARFKGKPYPEIAAEAEYRIPAMLTLAQFLRMSGNTAESLKQLDAADKIRDKDDMDSLSYLGYHYALSGKDTAKALRYTEQALKSSATDTVFAKNNAVALWKAGRLDDAEKMFKKTIALSRPTEFLHYDYGMFLLDTKRLDEAEAQFTKELENASELDPAKKALESVRAALKKKSEGGKTKKSGSRKKGSNK